ncbi:MAG: hypothetical protein HYY93_02900 [Planctomycetes bacterium]|nr:hypothetical protein [Planctomycetota bacterium]
MFVGQYTHTLDVKKRLVVPKKFRPFFGKREQDRMVYATLTQTADGAFLSLYPPGAWREAADRLDRAARERPEAERYLRKTMWDAEDCMLDGQWRCILPMRLIRGAGLDRKVVIAGVLSRIEVWDAPRWAAMDERLRAEAPDLQRFTYGTPGTPAGSP